MFLTTVRYVYINFFQFTLTERSRLAFRAGSRHILPDDVVHVVIPRREVRRLCDPARDAEHVTRTCPKVHELGGSRRIFVDDLAGSVGRGTGTDAGCVDVTVLQYYASVVDQYITTHPRITGASSSSSSSMLGGVAALLDYCNSLVVQYPAVAGIDGL